MPLLGSVGRKRPRARLAMALLYGLLSVGALTTVYPFAAMLMTGFKGPTDQNDDQLIPAYWTSDSALFAKYVDDKYAGDATEIAGSRSGSASSDLVSRYQAFLAQLPEGYWTAGFQLAPNQVTSRLDERYVGWLRSRFANIDELDRAYSEQDLAFQTVTPPFETLSRKNWLPESGRKYADWLIFKATLGPEFRLPVRETRMYQEFLRSKYRGSFSAVPGAARGGATSFETVSLPAGGALLADFRASWLPERYRARSAEDLWHAWAGRDVPMPIEAFEQAEVRRDAGSLRRGFAWRNYGYVLDYILLNGRSLWNTLIFCLLAIATQLTVNPLAAYALSRFPIRASGRILLFLLATMAFPAEVAMIPAFLLLKQLGLLNTFAALVLPTAASGYMIFLLKGFFDSLPGELFEAGQIDGASETTLMARIALPMSRPVLGYLALLAFLGAYGSFIYAFLVVQDQRMWTLMVWLYELQTTAPRAVVMAALTLSAVPTLIVFLLCQRVIMRGVIVPIEK